MGALPAEGDTFGRYEIIRRIGRGGMGSVYEARQPDLGRSVALKVLNPELASDPGFRGRFNRETHTLAGLDSPHIIQILEAGEHGGVLFIATQLINGRDLMRTVREDGPLSAPRALKVVAQVAAALRDAHEAGLLHRDVKPSNVLIRESRSDVFAYLCDFSIAREAVSSRTRTAGVIGTLSYMAPECHTGADATVASDVYSLGCLLWAALTGMPPYERDSEFQITLAHVHDEIPRYVGSSPAMHAVNEILSRSMAKDPARRYPSAGAMLDALLAAEMKARGLRSSTAEHTPLLGELSHQSQTVKRPSPAGLVGSSTTALEPDRGHPWRFVAVVAASLAVVLALGGAAFALLGPDQTPKPGSAARAETEPSGTPTPKVSVKAPPQRPSEGTPTSVKTSEPRRKSAMTCWDGSATSQARACPLPSGRAGLRSVFPAMDHRCLRAPLVVERKVVVFKCEYGSYLVRYSAWTRGADRYEYLDRVNPGARSAPWIIDGRFAGRTWTSFEDNVRESKRYQWSATYRYAPYSVSVEAVDEKSRAAGIASVAATAPEQVGLK